MQKLLVLCLAVQGVCGGKPVQKKKYGLVWTRGVMNCEGVPSDYMDLSQLYLERQSPKKTILKGVIRVLQDFPIPLQIKANIFMKNMNDYEFFTSLPVNDVCETLVSTEFNEYNTGIKQLGWTCPIRKNNYSVNHIGVPSDPEKSEFYGTIKGEIKSRHKILHNNTVLTCFVAYTKVAEV